MPDATRGLSTQEAARRLREQGPNELPQGPRRTLSSILLHAAREPMFQLLAAGVALYLLLGNAQEAALLLAFVAVTIGISVVQQQRTERVLQSLRELASPRALVLRDGQPCRIPGREVVEGDWLVLREGDRVAADAQLLSCEALRVDESLLTGESVPVAKVASGTGTGTDAYADADAGSQATPGLGSGPATPASPRTPSPGGDDQAWAWAGTLVVAGHGVGRVTATGARSAIGQLGRSLSQVRTPPSPLTLQTRRLVRIAAAAGGLASLVFVVAFAVQRQDALQALLAGVTLAMSLLPEEFTLILTVFMAMGAWRLSAARVLSRQPAAIEALGAATVLCTDKTGTLTLNRMAVVELAAPGPLGVAGGWVGWRDGEDGAALAPALRALLQSALLASPADTADPMERAVQTLGQDQLGLPQAPPGWSLVHAWGLQPDLLAMTHVWQVPGDDAHTVAAKGAPEAIAALCRLPAREASAWQAQAQAMAARGLRVIAVARASVTPQAPWTATPQGLGFEAVGLVGLTDPLRPQVPAAVRECLAAGIRVAMITGDHAATARAVAAAAGIDVGAGVLTGPEIEALDDDALRERLARVCVFARVMPAQKLRLVRLLQARGEVVAMTGDGVNDAPALKAAHIGIAMGARGTDVAREAAALVLLDDDFGAIVHGLRLGRRIVDNVRKAMAFVLAVHVPIAGLALLPLLAGWPPVFAPVHIAFLELLIDPACSIVFEAEADERDVMARPPRDPAQPLISRELVLRGLAQGGATLVATGALLTAAHHLQWPAALGRAAVFTALVLGVLALILTNRSFEAPWWRGMRQPNPALRWALGATLAMLALVLATPGARALFGFAPMQPAALLAAVGSALALLLVLEGGEALARRWPRRASRRA